MKKILSLIIAVMMIMGTMACVSVSAASELPEAVDQVITLTEDVVLTDTYTVPQGTTLTIDLAGHTISQQKAQTEAYSMIVNNGKLTIKDTIGGGRVCYTDTGNGGEYVSNTITNYGTLYIRSGATIENASSTTVGKNGYPYTIDNNSTVGNTSLYVYKESTILNSAYCTIRLFCNSTTNSNNVSISGGTLGSGIELQNPNANANKGKLTISGGTIEASDNCAALYVFSGSANADCTNLKAEISGGTIKDDIKFGMNMDTATGFNRKIVSNGTFTTDVTDLLVDGATLLNNGDGTYSLKIVAKVGTQEYSTLAKALSTGSTSPVTVLCDVEEYIPDIMWKEIVSGNPEGVTITNTNTGWVTFGEVTIGEGVTLICENPFFQGGSNIGENTILGTLIAGDTYYHAYNAKTTIKDGGKVIVNGTTILRYNAEPDSGIYIYGDGDASTVEFDCDYYIGSYSGTFYAENANIEAGYYLLQNSYDNEDYADMNLTLDNSTIAVMGTNDGQDSFIIDDQVNVVLKNGASIENVRDFTIRETAENTNKNSSTETKLTLSVDSTSKISAENMSITEGIPFDAVENGDGTFGVAPEVAGVAKIGDTYYSSFKEAFENVEIGDTITLLTDVELSSMVFLQGGMDVTVEGDGKTITFNTGTNFGFAVKESKLTLGKGLNVVTVGNTAAIYVQDGEVTTSANLSVNGECAAIQGNGQCKGDVTIIDGKITSTKTAAIYWPQNGNLVIKGGEIEGLTGVEIRAGSLTVEGGTITATGEFRTRKEDSGMTVYGAAVSLSQHSTNHPTTVTITGGTLKGEKAFYQDRLINGDAPSENISASIAAGVTLDGAVEAAEEGFTIPQNADGSYALVAPATDEPTWNKDTDAGYYTADGADLGMMRFLFSVDVAADQIKTAGIKYINASDIDDKVVSKDGSVAGNAFYGDVYGIALGTAGNYLAKAYIITNDDVTYWSDELICTPNFTQYFTDYVPVQ